MECTTIPDEKTRVEYIERVVDIFDDHGISLTVEQANREAERLYHMEHDDWLSAWKGWKEDEMCGL